MLEDAKVTISLKDLDMLRDAYKELEAIKNKIAGAIIVREIPNGEKEPIIEINVDLYEIDDLVKDYFAWRKEKYDWIHDVYSNYEIKTKYAYFELVNLEEDE
ncbi:hypothetical protein Y919_02660 [Caloranaerobacter azorensis H53214]|uniref:Uncharacterized protein n=1 Tax=Caloranaerobacter azorensis H53214 TaxID=1156417 RepID=A0A096BIU0_9FIRM|nr:hypothetical protein [Caloranaerobacter azorensis]KGG81080.1 hypothetical protein Y919_02660 [Caloranaerobacter azorensis H53214]